MTFAPVNLFTPWLAYWAAALALVVGGNILLTGWRLLSESGTGLMDAALTPQENADLADTIAGQCNDDVTVHGLRTRVAGHVSFAEFHVLIPGAWSVRRAHDVVEDIEAVIAEQHPDLRVTIHIEPSEDPRSYDDFGGYEIPIEPLQVTDFPTDKVYGEVDHAALRLITCGGHFDGETGHHVDNVVVYAELVDER